MDINGEWPSLPETAFVAGRLATEADFLEGRAVFYVKDAVGRPLDIEIPQYALLKKEDGAFVRVVVVQAQTDALGERAIVGMRDGAGNNYVATLGEVQLLGARPDL